MTERELVDAVWRLWNRWGSFSPEFRHELFDKIIPQRIAYELGRAREKWERERAERAELEAEMERKEHGK